MKTTYNDAEIKQIISDYTKLQVKNLNFKVYRKPDNSLKGDSQDFNVECEVEFDTGLESLIKLSDVCKRIGKS